MRLDYFIANATTLSRRDTKKAISAGLVKVDNQTCRKAGTLVAPESRITLEGQTLALPGERYLMLHKPEGVISATTDSQQPTALDLLPADVRRGLHIAGRLDAATTGLLLLTTDGQWSHRITSPRVSCPKTYRVTLSEPIDPTAILRLEQGVALHNEPTPTSPARVHKLDDRLVDLTISEGRYHQVRRMLAAVGNHVVGLHRWRIGDIVLDPELAPGQYRELTADEVGCLA
ncbi:pseudouridine synthase [Marinobacter panjinensis]|uniref:Pseudouridine synthase n=1 Tax=Marinobacter panjinensis TaxID=2576384 RepID=A0A4U6R4X9_9GAMM|nr:pseudouridine synthase [Marinobacter panjinensis]MCR8914596.1 pseudouridine synthase [Marinobacter panjinensis]TKV68583.1 pseudouridine synthase [Marinobacter panjinensis]